MGLRRELLPVERRRLQDGQRAMDLPTPITVNEMKAQLPIIDDGIRALQSLDDLGVELNKKTWRDMNELFKRKRKIERQLKKLKGARMTTQKEALDKCRACSELIVPISKNPTGLAHFKCKCTEWDECAVCHRPRTIWADDGTVCGMCALDGASGKKKLTKEQIDGVSKWTVTGLFLAPEKKKK